MLHAKQLDAVIPLFGGIYATLVAYRVIRLNPKNPEKEAWWHGKFGKMMKILGPVIIVSGILEFFGLF
jgi:hypothetical protein